MNEIEKNELMHTIIRKLKLDSYNAEMFIHDVNNLRGDEWSEEVQSLGDEELWEQYKELAGIESSELDDEEDEDWMDAIACGLISPERKDGR